MKTSTNDNMRFFGIKKISCFPRLWNKKTHVTNNNVPQQQDDFEKATEVDLRRVPSFRRWFLMKRTETVIDRALE